MARRNEEIMGWREKESRQRVIEKKTKDRQEVNSRDAK